MPYQAQGPNSHRIGNAVTDAVKYDYAFNTATVQTLWSDQFLTNVVVPFLEHLKEYHRMRENDYLLRPKLSPAEVKEFQEVLHEVNALQTTITICHEWRG